jgi:hypothetical protein
MSACVAVAAADRHSVIQHQTRRVKMQQDPREIDWKLDETLLAIAKLFGKIEFTAEEQRFVEDAGRKLVELSYETLVQWPKVEELRPFIVLFAIAATLGKNQVFQDGIPALRREAEAPPQHDVG